MLSTATRWGLRFEFLWGKIFYLLHTCPDRPWGPPRFHNENQGSFQGIQRRGVESTTHPDQAPVIRLSKPTLLFPLVQHWLILTNENSVYNAVRTKSLKIRNSSYFHLGGPGFILGQTVRDIMVDKWQRDWIFSEYFGFTLSESFQQCSILIFIYTLLLTERQTGEVWKPSGKGLLLRMSRTFWQRNLSLNLLAPEFYI